MQEKLEKSLTLIKIQEFWEKFWSKGQYALQKLARFSKLHTYTQCLNLLLGGSKKVGFQQKWCLTTPTDSLGYSKFNFFLFGPILGPILGHFGAQKPKKRPKNQNCWFSTIFCVENFFAHNFLHFIFLNGIHHISLDFFH